jgi:Icc protein
VQYGHYPAPRFTVAHLSDVHLLAHDARQYGVVDPEAGLRLLLDRLRRLEPSPDALVFTGDLADKAEPDAYARLRELVEPLAATLGAEVVWVMGNHDERAPFARGLYDTEDAGPQDRVHDVGGLRIVALDTSVPDYHHG